jgi:hypothetical protein
MGLLSIHGSGRTWRPEFGSQVAFAPVRLPALITLVSLFAASATMILMPFMLTAISNKVASALRPNPAPVVRQAQLDQLRQRQDQNPLDELQHGVDFPLCHPLYDPLLPALLAVTCGKIGER